MYDKRCKKSLKIPNSNSEKDNKSNDKKKKAKRINNDIQNITKKTKERATRTPQKSGGELRCSGKVEIPAPWATHVYI